MPVLFNALLENMMVDSDALCLCCLMPCISLDLSLDR